MKSEIQINNTAGVCQIDIEGTIGVPEEWQFEEPDARVATYERFRDAVRRIAEAIVRNEHSVLPVTSMIYGHYGVDGICLGVPTIVGRNGAEAVLDIPLSEEELAQLQRSANTMREMIDKLDG